MEEILKYFPSGILGKLNDFFEINKNIENELQEIRIRSDKPIILKMRFKDYVIDYRVEQSEVLRTLEKLCENSIYAYKNQLCEGFLTVKGGHRIGVTGTVVIENQKVININYINSLNFRIARQVVGCSNDIIGQILDIKNKTIYNTLLVSPPGKGKTTMLRDVIRNISNGIAELKFNGLTCGVVDERGEIAAVSQGIVNLDVGKRTDVISNVPKYIGMEMLVRSMGIDVIATDEIGNYSDIEAIKYANCSGVGLVFTMHGKDLTDILKRDGIKELLHNNLFRNVIVLSNKKGVGTVENIYNLEDSKTNARVI